MPTADQQKGVTGTVKWFSNRKGFGFIASDLLSEEIFVHQTGIVTNGAFRTLQESSKVKFDVEKEEGSGKLKAVNVTNEDGTPIVPPARQPRRNRNNDRDDHKAEGGEDGEAAGEPTPAAPTAEDGDGKENKTAKAGAGGGARKNYNQGRNRNRGGGRNNNANNNKAKNGDGAAADKDAAADKHDGAAAASNNKDPPFHAVLTDTVKSRVTNERKLTLGNRTTIDVAVGDDTRIKLGQGGYTAICLKSAVIGEGTFVCEANGTVAFTWTRALECKNGAWTTTGTDNLIKSISLVDEQVGPVGAHETANSFFGDDKPDPKEAFEAHGFQMRRVVLTKPPNSGGGRFRGRGGRNQGGRGGGGGKKSEGVDQADVGLL